MKRIFTILAAVSISEQTEPLISDQSEPVISDQTEPLKLGKSGSKNHEKLGKLT